MKKNIGLIILDGWGIGDKSKSDAIFHAFTPNMDSLQKEYPSSQLTTFGESVGLPEGQMGNSEVGHLNIGAGRVVYQELTRINNSIKTGDFFKIELLKQCLQKVIDGKNKLHFIGLVSKGGVHSTQEHLYALLDFAHLEGVNPNNIFIHAFTDGRDCDPKSGLNYLKELESKLEKSKGRIASVIGRYYSMDRDNRWERIKKAYDLMVHGNGKKFESASESIQFWYSKGITDEFIEPSIITEEGVISENDIVICFNYRTDRPREISSALTQKSFLEYNMFPLNIDYYTMTNYDQTFKNVSVIFEKDNLNLTLGDVLSRNNKTQLRIAETEKYPHVTFFFNGGREVPFDQESRILVNSPKVATYDLKPEMSAHEITEKISTYLQNKKPNFFCLNFANPDMVGHTGNYNAIIKAVETVDACLGKIINVGNSLDYEFLIIADHGNADIATNKDGSPNTAHTLNPVPAILISKDKTLKLNNGILADIAPTILDRMGISIPEEMNGKSLIK